VIQRGYELARRQLQDIVEVGDGAVELLNEWEGQAGHVFEISLDTSGATQRPEGIAVRARERFKVLVDDGFPYEHPSVLSVHRRWAGTPHVQWGSYLCLYAAPSIEWNPSDGMRGLISRLSEWIDHAAEGTLDPEGQPLHPPAVYTSSDHGSVLIHPDIGERAPWAAKGLPTDIHRMMAWCAVGNQRLDLLEWVAPEEAVQRAISPNAEIFHNRLPLMAVPVVLVSDELGFEYPTRIKLLSDGLSELGYDKGLMMTDLAWAGAINKALRLRQVSEDRTAADVPWHKPSQAEDPLLSAMIIGTPSRSVDGDARLAHLAAWKLDPLEASIADLFSEVQNLEHAEKLKADVNDLARRWFDVAAISWMDVMEMRPEVTQRRDQGTPASWLNGKRVLVLGCGALGAPVAEYCVRAGALQLTVADKGTVTPGILVRQPYTDLDIGKPKADALASRLSTISTTEVHPVVGNVRTTLFNQDAPAAVDDFDLIVDASADTAVRVLVERWLMTSKVRVPLVTMVIGHQAERGLVTTSLADSTTGGVGSFRKVALRASAGFPEWQDVRDDFFPEIPRTELFFPEPGCSAPTFVGSAAQTTALAGLLLNEALLVLNGGKRNSNAEDQTLSNATSFASVVRLGDAATRATSHMAWPSDIVLTDHSSGFLVQVSASAMAEVRAEVRRGSRIRGEEIETGGMLFGSFDEALGVVFVDSVAGPPPDSYLSEIYFQHGVEGVQKRVDAELKRSGMASGFVGFWHTHPGGEASPSETDKQGMHRIVGPDGSLKRALMMIFGGPQGLWSTWRDSTPNIQPRTFVRVVPRPAESQDGEPACIGGLQTQSLPPGRYFRGGYSQARSEMDNTSSEGSAPEVLRLLQRFFGGNHG